MTQYAAQILNSIVTWVILADYVWANENLEGVWVDCTTENGEPAASEGFIYDSTTDTFNAPEAPIEP